MEATQPSVTDWIQAVSSAIVMVATIVAVLAAIGAWLVAHRQAKATKEQAKDQARNAEILDAPVLRVRPQGVGEHEDGVWVHFVVETIGGTPALDLQLTASTEAGDMLGTTVLQALAPGEVRGMRIVVPGSVSGANGIQMVYGRVRVTIDAKGRLGALVRNTYLWRSWDWQQNPDDIDAWVQDLWIVLPTDGRRLAIQSL